MEPKQPCRRTRFLCRLCQQTLGYSAFHRHQDLPHLYCPGYVPPMASAQEESDSESSDSTFIFDIPSAANSPFNNTTANGESEYIPVPSPDEPLTSSQTQSSDDSDSAPEVWDEADTSSSETDSEADESHQTAPVKHLHYIVCLFLAFFQLCFHVSDKALSHLLSFLSALLNHFCSHVKDAPYFIAFAKTFPTTLYSLRKYLKLKNSYVKYAVCPRCHKLYKESECLVRGSNGVTTSLKCNHIEYPNHPQLARRKKCGAELMKKVKIGQTYKFVPRKVYVYYSIIDSLQRLASTPGFLKLCEEWRESKGNVPNGYLTDVFDGRLWSEWVRQDGVPFLEVPGNLLFMLNIDWFQPFDHTQYSVGVIYLAIQNLPRAVRFKPENVIIVSTIPGPNEPDYNHLNPYLEPMVNDLLTLWQGVQIKTPHSIFSSKLVRAALCFISSDLPATRKVCGFYGYQANYGCSKCLKTFPSTFSTSPDYSGFDQTDWQPRTLALHRLLADRVKNAATRSDRERIEHEAGVRYSELLRLPYLDIVRCHLVDPMHNLFLGTSKRMLTIWKARDYLKVSMFEKLQEQMDSINPPANMGRIPCKISAGFAGFTAEQWMLWTILYSPVVLRGLLPHEHYTLWCFFSRACVLLCRPYIHEKEVDKADELLLSFCTGFEQLYGREACTANLHMHCHLKECILDVGPLYSFWCFSFERYNGILDKMTKSWHAPELQLIHKFSNLQTLAAVVLPEDAPIQLVHCFKQAKEYKSALPDPVIDSISVLKYEQHMMCVPEHICALKLPFHRPIPPGREKFMMEVDRKALIQMYNALYCAENVGHVPLRYTQFHQVRVFEQVYTSTRSRTSRSSAIIAIWPHLSGILTSRLPSMDDVRVEVVEYFMIHTPAIKLCTNSSASPSSTHNVTVEPKQHLLAYVKWYQDHPQKFVLGNGIVLSATVTEHMSSASFMPISRILSRCAIVDTKVQLNYGEDKVCIVIPVRRHYLF